MAKPTLIRAALPGEPELQSFARAAAQLLIERQMRTPGARAVARRPGIGIQHLDHRDYAPGDEVRHIDWRVTARHRRPIVRRFESESMSDWTILLDASSSMAVRDAAKWRAAVQVAAAMSYALLQLGHRVGVLAYGARVLAECPRGRGPHHYAAIARALAALRPEQAGERSELGVCARHLHGAASVFTLSDFLADDEMRRDLGAILQRCTTLHALQLIDGAETALRVAGEFDLVDVETGAQMHTQASERANALATAERAGMTGRLRGFCARSGVVFSEWDIARPWQHALLAHLVQARSHC
ncbi:MAG: DUF58 domain-containing protein [Rubrivivax sp.]|nr:DUF58 domain-containing protein [Rubrivivax sp.]